MASVIELGQKVKAKYPGQYDDLADADVGRKVKARFPGQYDDFTEAPLGRGDLQASEAALNEDQQKEEIVGKATNVPAHLLTGTPIDRQRAEALWNGGVRTRPLTGRQAAQGMALLAAPLVAPLAATPPGAAAAGGALTGLGTTGATDLPGVAKDVAVSTVGGVVGDKALRVAAAPVARFAQRKLGEAAARATSEAAKLRTAEVRSASGTLASARSENNRVVEAIRELLENPSTSPEDKAILEGLRNTPEYQAALASLTQSLAARLPQVAGKVATGEAAMASANALPSVTKMAEQRVSAPVAWEKIMDRVRRYWLPLAGGALGYAGGDMMGMGAGALAGRAMSPSVQALWRMTKDPAVQTQIWTPVEKLAAAMAGRPTAAALSGPTAPAVGDSIAELLARAMGHPSLAPAVAKPEGSK